MYLFLLAVHWDLWGLHVPSLRSAQGVGPQHPPSVCPALPKRCLPVSQQCQASSAKAWRCHATEDKMFSSSALVIFPPSKEKKLQKLHRSVINFSPLTKTTGRT
ncbi:uncharacterized [Tachysurus ichikawai]